MATQFCVFACSFFLFFSNFTHIRVRLHMYLRFVFTQLPALNKFFFSAQYFFFAFIFCICFWNCALRLRVCVCVRANICVLVCVNE